MDSSAVLIEPHYLPCLEYFQAIGRAERLILEKHENFVKQTYRNRCYINTSNGVSRLVVPLAGRHGKVPFGEVRIDTGIRWRNNHWRTIQSAYQNAPYFEHYSDELNHILFADFRLLFDLNLRLLSFCLTSVGIQRQISETVAYEQEVPENVFDLRSRIIERKAALATPATATPPYTQVFGNAFAPNLSLIDLLFCAGPESGSLLPSRGGAE